LRARLLALPDEERRAVLASLTPEAAESLLRDWRFRARDSQLAPEGSWRTWLVMAGRGFGKTRCGAEWVLERVAQGARRIHLVGATAADVRDTMIEGESGILTVAPPHLRPEYIPSKRLLRWANGARALCFSAEKPRQLRGPQCDTAWADEPCAWEREDAWTQLMFGLRLWADPRCVVTTTPRPTKLVKAIIKAAGDTITRGSTYENAANLAEQYIAEIIAPYEGTRLGLQEIHAAMLEDTPGALWTLDLFDTTRIAASAAPAFDKVVVAVDPSASSSEGSAETGIIGAGVAGDHGFVVDDRSGKMSPGEWGDTSVLLYDELEADEIIGEVNNGGDMVGHVIATAAEKLFREGRRTSPEPPPYRAVHASRGKRTRAEPIATFYENGRCHNVGVHRALEDQSSTWDASSGAPSPDRMDAMVWALWALLIDPKSPISRKAVRSLAKQGRGLLRPRT
jgi:phage terminase large subunit-like protein